VGSELWENSSRYYYEEERKGFRFFLKRESNDHIECPERREKGEEVSDANKKKDSKKRKGKSKGNLDSETTTTEKRDRPKCLY